MRERAVGCLAAGCLAAAWYVAIAGCGEDGTADHADAVHAVPTCDGDSMAPLADGSGGLECVVVGAGDAPVSDEWPDASFTRKAPSLRCTKVTAPAVQRGRSGRRRRGPATRLAPVACAGAGCTVPAG